MKTIAFAGGRLFMKFAGVDYFRTRAIEEGFKIIEARSPTDAEFVEEVKHADAIALIARAITAETIAALENCKLIQTLSVGYDCVDTEAATEAGIPVCNTPSYCTDEVSNHAMTLILALARKIHTIMPRTRNGEWDYNFTRPIHNFRDKTLGIVGLGRVGRTLVPKAQGFGIRVSAYDPYLDDDIFSLLGVKRRYELHDLLADSDYVSIHAPLTAETRGMIGNAELDYLKRSAVIVNTARGPIWDETAVADAVRSERIAGAGADVMATEPPATDHPFLGLDNMIVTPHVAWYSEESFQKEMVDAMDEIARVLNGQRPRWIVNPEIFSRSRHE